MNAVQAHLILDHVPVIGWLFTTVLFFYGFTKKNYDIEKLGLLAFVFLALLTIPVWLTGLAIGDLVEGVMGVSYNLIKLHKQSATASLVAVEFLGVWAMIGLYRFRKSLSYPRTFSTTILILSVISSFFMIWTGHTGAQIQHNELITISHLIEPTKNGGRPYDPLDQMDRDR